MDDRWLKVFQPRPEALLRLFCFPYAGGGAAVYREWSQELPADIEVAAVQPPGRESRWREEPFRAMEPLADAATAALRPHLGRPFAFFGHSLGAALAFEVTRRLRRAGDPLPRHLFVSGRPAPSAPRESDPIHALPRAEFVAAVGAYSGTPEEVLQNAELMELVEPLLRADFAVSETYRPPARPESLDVPITALGGADDSEVSEDALAAWQQETAAPFHLEIFPGGHFFLAERRREVLRFVAGELAGHLAVAR